MTEPEPDRVKQALRVLLFRELPGPDDDAEAFFRERLAGVSPDDLAEAQRQLPLWLQVEAGEKERRIRAFEVFAPHMKAGAKTWDEIFERLSDADVQRLNEIMELGDG